MAQQSPTGPLGFGTTRAATYERHTSATLRELAPVLGVLGVAWAASVPYLVRQAANATPQSEIAAAVPDIERRLELR